MADDVYDNTRWLKQYPSWIEAAAALKARQQSFVLITVLTVTGSAPRPAGTKMLVCDQGVVDTIGGGHLEYKAMAKAQSWLAASSLDGGEQLTEEYPLGARLGQCCGGRVTLLYERFLVHHKPVFIFGAGHVARALVSILAELPLKITWVDSRPEEFPDTIPHNARRVISDQPYDNVMDIPPATYVIVMTHNHTLDFDIVRHALSRDDLAYVGVIGSQTKANRFRNRLEHRGFSADKIRLLHCPIGLSSIPGKRPMEVAVSVAGELIGRYHADQKKAESTAEPMVNKPEAKTPSTTPSSTHTSTLAGEFTRELTGKLTGEFYD